MAFADLSRDVTAYHHVLFAVFGLAPWTIPSALFAQLASLKAKMMLWSTSKAEGKRREELSSRALFTATLISLRQLLWHFPDSVRRVLV